VVSAPNEWRGQIALAAYFLGLPNPAYRNIVEAVWDHDHPQLLGEAADQRINPRSIITAARFR